MKAIVNIIWTALLVFVLAYLLPGVDVDGYLTAIIVAVVLGLLNFTIKPLLIILTLPITIFTLGLFLLIINALMIILASYFVPGFKVDGFWWALIYCILLSIGSSWFHYENRAVVV